jgi:glycosyltransferase involved in cell wall biosynthesis
MSSEIRWIFSTSLMEAEISELAQREVTLDCERLQLITVGRQDGAKGTENLIKALALTHRQHPNAVLDIVGDGSNLLALKRKAQELGCSDRVIFHGKVNHDGVLDLLGKAHIFCFPTESEGFPKAVLEAMACGLPVIATPVSVLPLLLANGCGVLINPRPEAIAEAVCAVVSSPDRYKQMSAQARETARQYTLERWRDTIGGYLSASWGPLKPTSRGRKALICGHVVSSP